MSRYRSSCRRRDLTGWIDGGSSGRRLVNVVKKSRQVYTRRKEIRHSRHGDPTIGAEGTREDVDIWENVEGMYGDGIYACAGDIQKKRDQFRDFREEWAIVKGLEYWA